MLVALKRKAKDLNLAEEAIHPKVKSLSVPLPIKPKISQKKSVAIEYVKKEIKKKNLILIKNQIIQHILLVLVENQMFLKLTT